MNQPRSLAFVPLIVLLAGAAPAIGQSSEPAAPSAGNGWAVTVAPYLWATSLNGNATIGGTKADVDLPFEDILKDLSFGAMLLVDVEKDRFGVAVNGVFARISPDNKVNDIKIDATSDTFQLGVAPYYRVVDWTWRESSSGRPMRLTIEPEVGFRLTYLRAEIEVRDGPTVDEHESWVDPLIGSRFSMDLSDQWTIVGEGNVGGFGAGSDLAWNVQGLLGYTMLLFGRETTLALGYRALHQDYDHSDFKWDVTMQGPFLGAALHF